MLYDTLYMIHYYGIKPCFFRLFPHPIHSYNSSSLLLLHPLIHLLLTSIPPSTHPSPLQCHSPIHSSISSSLSSSNVAARLGGKVTCGSDEPSSLTNLIFNVNDYPTPSLSPTLSPYHIFPTPLVTLPFPHVKEPGHCN